MSARKQSVISNYLDFTFHNTTSGNGNILNVGNYKSITLTISENVGTCTFYGKNASGVVTNIMAIKVSDWSNATSTTGNGTWELSVSGLDTFYVHGSENCIVTGRALE